MITLKAFNFEVSLLYLRCEINRIFQPELYTHIFANVNNTQDSRMWMCFSRYVLFFNQKSTTTHSHWMVNYFRYTTPPMMRINNLDTITRPNTLKSRYLTNRTFVCAGCVFLLFAVSFTLRHVVVCIYIHKTICVCVCARSPDCFANFSRWAWSDLECCGGSWFYTRRDREQSCSGARAKKTTHSYMHIYVQQYYTRPDRSATRARELFVSREHCAGVVVAVFFCLGFAMDLFCVLATKCGVN